MGKSSKYIKYVKIWEEHPQLKKWIGPMEGDIRSAFCKVCRSPVYPNKKDLLRHSKSKKHVSNMLIYESVLESCRPLKDSNFEDNAYEIQPIMSSNNKNITISVYPESAEVIQEELLQTQDADGIVNRAAIVISGEENLPTSEESLVSWMNLPEFQGWLDVTSNRLSCIVCKKELKPNKTFLLKHASSKLHQNNSMKNKINFSNSRSKELEDYRFSVTFGSDPTLSIKKVIDLRSDTVMKPSKEMKEAMLNTSLGDDYFGSDPTVKELENKVATLLGKECGLLAPSGTMANLIAVMAHCWSRDSEVIVGDLSHLYKWSQGSLARLFGISTRPIKNENDGTFSLNALKAMIQQLKNSKWPANIVVCIENTHSEVGGKPLPLDWLTQVGEFCCQNGILLHMDGARLMNACIYCGTSPEIITQHCNSSTFCLNKAFGAPMGSVIVGDSEFLTRAKSIRTLLGGTMHQAGIFAAAGLYTLKHNASKLKWDHTNARAIALGVRDLHSSAVRVELDDVQTNIVHLLTDNIRVNAQELCDRLATVKEKEVEKLGFEAKLYLSPLTTSTARIVTHGDLSRYDMHLILKKLKYVIEEYDNMLNLNFEKTF